MQFDVFRVKRRGLRTHPCAEPVLSVMLEQQCGPSLTDCGWSFKKFLIHRKVVERPRYSSFCTRVSGMMLLNAELKSEKKGCA